MEPKIQGFRSLAQEAQRGRTYPVQVLQEIAVPSLVGKAGESQCAPALASCVDSQEPGWGCTPGAVATSYNAGAKPH